MNRQDIIDQLQDGALITLSGGISISSPIDIPYSRVTIRGDGTEVLGADCAYAFKFTGNRCRIDDIEIQSAGMGILLEGGLHQVDRCRITSESHGITLKGGGHWVTKNHFNGHPGNSSSAIRIDNLDTAWIIANLSEEHDTGSRVAMDGSVSNVVDAMNKFDRCRAASYHLEPGTGFSIWRYQVMGGWGSGGNSANGGTPGAGYPFLANGDVEVEVSNMLFCDFTRKEMTAANGAIIHVSGPITHSP